MRARICVALTLLMTIAACGPKASVDISGTWVTETPVPYIVESTLQAPHGAPVPHEGVQILERSMTLKWTLVQRHDGLITGTNSWTSHDETGEEVSRGNEPLLGTYDGEQLILVESGTEGPQIRFEVTPNGGASLQGVGHGMGASHLVAMQFVLTRKSL